MPRGIEDDEENYTRFFLVRRSGRSEDRSDSKQDERGLYARAQTGLAGGRAERAEPMGTNLTKIESRPVKGKPWEYIFYVDCKIGSSAEGTRALEALERHCGMVKELGRYREANGVTKPGNKGATEHQNPETNRAGMPMLRAKEAQSERGGFDSAPLLISDP